MCVATWFAHELAGHLLQRGRQFFVLRSSALRGGPNVFSFFGRPCTNSATAFCRIVSAFSRHSAAGTCIDPDTVCVAVVSLWLSGDRSEEHTSELQSQSNLVCRLLLEKKK